jgi:hypothetical protein
MPGDARRWRTHDGQATSDGVAWRTKMKKLDELETDLNDFNPVVRAEALQELASLARQEVLDRQPGSRQEVLDRQPGSRQESVPLLPEAGVVNMHCHTFFSFNAFGYSPSALAWLGRRYGFDLMGIVDFDVLDGVDEFLDACEMVSLRGSAGIETRVFIPEYGQQEINSPGEPGVCYHMGIGFTSSQVPAAVAPILADLGRRADQRNQGILARVNDYLDPVAIDYHRDVVPLTPMGHPTERHMVMAYVEAARRTVANPTAFWAGKLGVSPIEMAAIMADSTKFQNLIRARLMKQGGVGYVQPQSGMFPSLEAFHELIVACGALPCCAWLDGTSATEQAIEDWLAFLIARGVVTLNIIPDRNWNIANPEARRRKVQNLYRVVELARELDLPLNIGTEMNSFGQKTVDDFDAPELAPLRQAFLEGAYFVYGHTIMQRNLGLGYQSEWSLSSMPTRRERNEFYTELGRLVPPGPSGLARLRQSKLTAPPVAPSPADILSTVRR